MTAELLDKLAEHGVSGVLLAIAIAVIYSLYKEQKRSEHAHSEELKTVQAARTAEVEAVQKLRIEDARVYQNQILDLAKSCVAAITSSIAATNAEEKAVGELKRTIENLIDNLRV